MLFFFFYGIIKKGEEMSKNKRKIKVGGVALFDGILFTSDYRQVITRQYSDRVRCQINTLTKDNRLITKIPILRGILGIGSQIGNAAPNFIKSSGEQDGKNASINTLFLYIVLIIFCISIPILISAFFRQDIRNIVQLIVIFVEFLLYVVTLKSISDFNVLFMYHGAEHKVVNGFENLDIKDMTLENVKNQSRFHKRCGGNLIVYFIILTMLSVFIPVDNLVIKAIIMILLALINIGIAYEIVNLFSKLKKPFDIINYPATIIQFFTTKEPTDKMLKLALYGVLGATREKNGIVLSEYIKKYINENLKDIKYDIQDIYSILEYITGTNINNLILNKDSYLLTLNNEIKADLLLNRYYFEKYPLQYITHNQYFYNEKYYVDENVLIPRSDSEILVEKAIEYIQKESLKNVIDLCTGSGALGISIAKNSNIDKMTLIDISLQALKIANRNIRLNGVNNKVITLNSDLLQNKIIEIEKQENIEDKRVDMIVSNPPYIKTNVLPSLDEQVKKEPKLALDGGETGLDFYIRIIEQAKRVLKPNGILIFEIGYDQLNDLKEIISKNNEYKLLESVKDYGGNDRVVICRFLEK